jgi:tetratricopeptide (TPR) repeat protein
MRTICAIVGVVALLDSPPPRIERIGHWVDAVMQHRPGANDAALERVASMSIADIQTLAIDAQTLLTLMRHPRAMRFFTPGPGSKQIEIRYSVAEIEALRSLAKRMAPREDNDALNSRLVNGFLERAALLEGDVAMLGTTETVPMTHAPPGGAFNYRVKVSDGQMLSIYQGPLHWALARKMLDLITPNPASDPMVRAWYIATIAQLEAAEQHDTDHLERASAIFPLDPVILFFNGCLHEVYASDRVQAAVKVMHLPPGLSLGVGSARSELQLAEAFLKKAVAADAEAPEARLHLGRVLGLLGRHQEAAVELGRAEDRLGDEMHEYYAALFLGREEEALGRLDAAQVSYERAASLYPGAQSAHLALSQLAWRRPDRTAALTAIRDALDATGEDPWWTYDVAHAHRAGALLDELRRPFVEARP